MSHVKGSGFGVFAAIVAAIALVAGGAYVAYRFLLGRELTPLSGAEVVPEQAWMTVYLSTDSQDWSQLEQFGTPRMQQLVSENLDRFREQTTIEDDFAYEEDIQPWLGGVMLAYLPSDNGATAASAEDLMAVVGVKNKFELWRFNRKLKQEEDTQINQTQYRGVTVFELVDESQDSIYSAVLGNRLVLASQEETLQSAIDAAKGETSYLNQEGARSILAAEELEIDNPLVQVFVADYGGLVEEILAMSPNGSEIPPQTLAQLEAIESAAFGVGTDEYGLHLQGTVKVDPDNFQQPYSPTQGAVLSLLPQDTLLVVTGSGISKLWSMFAEQAADYPELERGLDATRQQFSSVGLDLDREILGWLDGEYAFAAIALDNASPFYPLPVGGATILQTSDRATGEETIAKLEDLVEQSGSGLFPSRETLNGVEVTRWITPQQQTAIAYGWINEDTLLMAIAAPFVEVAEVEGGTSLARNGKFEQLAEALPGNNFGYFYLDFDRTRMIFEDVVAAQGGSLPPDVTAVLESLNGVIATVAMPDRATSRVDVIFDLERNASAVRPSRGQR